MRHSREDYNDVDLEQKIPGDEPVFLIRGQDVCAADAIEAWAGIAKDAGADAAIVENARTFAEDVRTWQRGNPDRVKVPDAP